VRLIRVAIEEQEAEKQKRIEELDCVIQEYEEDLEFHLVLLQECSESENTTSTVERPKVETQLIDSEWSPQKLSREQYQESKDKAWAWRLDRKREKEHKEQGRRWVRQEKKIIKTPITLEVVGLRVRRNLLEATQICRAKYSRSIQEKRYTNSRIPSKPSPTMSDRSIPMVVTYGTWLRTLKTINFKDPRIQRMMRIHMRWSPGRNS
jgi:hypothetical protein